jgi:pterin-4a-carbinolamine dehydratase
MLRIELNMKRVSDIMSEYFEEGTASSNRALTESSRDTLPIHPKRSEWEYVKEPQPCLYAKFSFATADTYAYFLSEVSDLEKRMGHHGKLECEYPDIAISIRTHTLDMVTRQDVKYTKKVLQIFKDAKSLEESK